MCDYRCCNQTECEHFCGYSSSPCDNCYGLSKLTCYPNPVFEHKTGVKELFKDVKSLEEANEIYTNYVRKVSFEYFKICKQFETI